MTSCQVTFPLQKIQISAPQGITLAEAAAIAGLPLNLVCGGKGLCGKCTIRICDSIGRRQVLACRTLLERPTEIYLNPEDLRSQPQLLLSGQSSRTLRLAPALAKAFVPAGELLSPEEGAFTEYGDPFLLKKLSSFLEAEDFTGITVLYQNGRPLDLQTGDTSDLLYGAACDIGTTSVALYLFDLNTGCLLHSSAALNRQTCRGADVLSRISYCRQDSQGTAQLQQLLFDTINDLLAEAALAFPALREHLYALILCGNTTMQHFFFGFSTKALGQSPFVSLSLKEQSCLAEALPGLNLPGHCAVTFLPLLGGFVGGDTTAVLLTLPEDGKLRLAVDLGTNGEIALGQNGRYLVASTACGPALEGAVLDCGMRGEAGAVEQVDLVPGLGLRFRVIGGGKARGLCGSGSVALLAALLKAGVLRPDGRLLRREEYEKLQPSSPLAPGLELKDGTPAFFLTPDVWLSQKDIRQLQLAKSAIAAGCLALLAGYGCSLEEVEELILAGAFGSHIDVKSALAIGLLPAFPPERIRSVGNAAGQGAALALLDQKAALRAREIAAFARHQDLACDPVFLEEYIKQMNFPH